jgi:hypothetical protein
MKYVIKKKQSNTGTIHDIASDQVDRIIEGRGNFAVVEAAYYGGKGYTTHASEAGAIKQAQKLSRDGYSFQIIDADGEALAIYNSNELRRI